MKEFFRFIGTFLSQLFKKKADQPKVSSTSKEEEIEKTDPFKVIDYINILQWHETRTWSKRTLSKINKIVVHQSLTEGTLEGINRYHITPGPQNHISPKGAPHICYHFAVTKAGKVYQCNHLSSLVWHTKGQNTSGIGIVLLGNFNGPSYKGTQEPTDIQLVNTNKLIDFLLKRDDIKINSKEVYGHKDFGKENCPGTEAYKQIVEPRRS